MTDHRAAESGGGRGHRVPAPLLRTRLRAAPRAALALAVLVGVIAFLAAALPRADDTVGSRALRSALDTAGPSRTTVELTAPQPSLALSPHDRAAAVSPDALARVTERAARLFPAPLAADVSGAVAEVRTTDQLVGTDPGLPRPEAVPPRFSIHALDGLAEHSRVVDGRLPRAPRDATENTRAAEAAVTEATARALHLRVGSTVHTAHVNGAPGPEFTVSGILRTLEPGSPYWSADSQLRTPGLAATSGKPPSLYWSAALLLPAKAAPVLLGTQTQPELVWRFAPDTDGLTGADADGLVRATASLQNGPAALRLRTVAGPTAAVTTGLGAVVTGHTQLRDTLRPLVTAGLTGAAAVAALVLTAAAAVLTRRRGGELALLRARGAGLPALAARTAAETAVCALPAAALGLLLARLALPEGRDAPAVLAVAAVAGLVCAVPPLLVLAGHRVPRVHDEREDLAAVRPGRRRLVVEATAVLLTAGSLVALRTTGADSTAAIAVAPVLTALLGALLLLRLTPPLLRRAARAAARLRGSVVFLALARAGRAPAATVFPLCALVIALTTAAFGGSVLAGTTDARDRAAVLATGADARADALGSGARLAPGAERTVAALPGVDAVTAVAADRDARAGDATFTAVAVPADAYARLARSTGLGGFAPDELGTRSGAVGAVASPQLARRLGTGPQEIEVFGRTVTVRVAAVRTTTPAVPAGAFLVLDQRRLPARAGVTSLLVTGAPADAQALERAARAGSSTPVRAVLRSDVRAQYASSSLQKGSVLVYAAAVAAAGAFAALALALSLLHDAAARTAFLGRLRTLGLGVRQGRYLALLEAVPLAATAAVGGIVTGWAAIALAGPAIDLRLLALGPARTGQDGAAVPEEFSPHLSAAPAALALPAAAVLVLAAVVTVLHTRRAGDRRPRSAGQTPSERP
ncbi:MULTISPECIES: FtsX-like permease family protein [unclassified Streptomyces]|uniref:FtsX-like permease family protein n=1 Tax=unclassified Streptomyces TaxID=2593676 RepID=UPI000DB9F40A|nr:MULTISPECIES: FtsX-like permease family protein [unclassified Streptomyces]MYT71226.1 ABC transporter permease [Streptomyces sp. SID8367]RAJ72493.1 putative ABC transport system permease protein [Streptomyces sp. PsTaAH-137]